MAYIQTANRTIERSPNVAAIGADNRDYQACQESLRRRRERELVALWRQQWGREHASVTLTCRREHGGKSRASECAEY